MNSRQEKGSTSSFFLSHKMTTKRKICLQNENEYTRSQEVRCCMLCHIIVIQMVNLLMSYLYPLDTLCISVCTVYICINAAAKRKPQKN